MMSRQTKATLTNGYAASDARAKTPAIPLDPKRSRRLIPFPLVNLHCRALRHMGLVLCVSGITKSPSSAQTQLRIVIPRGCPVSVHEVLATGKCQDNISLLILNELESAS